MSEGEVVASGGPATRRSVAGDLGALGVAQGSTLLVHCSLSQLGWVAGGAHAVVLALLDVVGPTGTLVMPTHSGGLSDPKDWENPPVPQSWWQTIRDEIPAFDPLLTPSRQMGAVSDCFRHVDGVRRSKHPLDSFAAYGPNRDAIVDDHQLAFGLGEGSPLARLYELDAHVLLLGVGHGNNTSLHLGEYRADYPDKRWIVQHGPVLVDGARQWIGWDDLFPDDSDFEALGVDFAATGDEVIGPVASGSARLMSQRSVVDFATEWFGTRRGR
jgi:aminoglycoside 3-N-acetyltransferase